MEFFGTIARASDEPPLRRDEWLAVCKTHPNLSAVPPKVGPNPFKPDVQVEYRTPEDTVRVMIGGHHIGTMSWAEDDSPLVNVLGNDAMIDSVAQELAESLSAVFVHEVA